MLDVFNIPYQSEDIKIFNAISGSNWQTWTKPRKCNYVWMMCIGAGNGGATPGTTSAEVRAGGTGAITRALFPASVLPDILFVQPGFGGVGAPAGTLSLAGAIGSLSYVAITPSVASTMNIVCVSGQIAASSLGSSGAAAVTQANLLNLSSFTSQGGQNSSTAGSSVTPFAQVMLSAGANNAVGAAGRNVVATAISPVITGGSTGGGNGANGIWSWKPMWSLGGAGGGANAAGAGGNGGDGAYGSGGGSGGVGTTIGGAGGKGGDGLVMIVTF